MAETYYTYSVENDFPNQAVDISKFFIEIGESNIVTECSHITVDGDVCQVYFVDALTSEDKNILDGLVSVHDGEPIEQESSDIIISSTPSVDSSFWMNQSDGFLYFYDSVRMSWLSSVKDYPIFSKKGRASGLYLPLVTELSVQTISLEDEESTVITSDDAYMSGKLATIVGIFCRSKRGIKDMQFQIRKNGINIFSFAYDGSGSFIYNNNELNLEIDSYDGIQIYVVKKSSGVVDTTCRLEISWRYEE